MTDCVEKLENRGAPKPRKCSAWWFQPLQGSVESMRAPAIVFAVIDVVPHLAAREAHQRSGEFSAISEKGLFQHNRHGPDLQRCPLFGRYRGRSGRGTDSQFP